MFTSRAEHRLLLRIDNADLRLTPVGRQVGLVDDGRWDAFESRRRRYDGNLSALHKSVVDLGSGRIPAVQYLRQPGNRLEALIEPLHLDVAPESRALDVSSVETVVKYEGYLKQEASRAAQLRRQERRHIPGEFPFARVPGLSREVVQRLSQVRPETLGQASRVPGVTPAAVAVLSAYLGRLASTDVNELP